MQLLDVWQPEKVVWFHNHSGKAPIPRRVGWLMIYTHAVAALVSASIAATGAWQVQNWRYGAKEKDREHQNLVAVQQSAATTVRRLDNVLVAQNAGAVRAIRLRTDLDSSRTELDRLRAQLILTMHRAETSTGSCVERVDPARELLAACAAELQDLAGKADRHASDVKTLTDGWPK